MVVVYSIPSSSYQPGSEPEPTLDEVEILGPPPALSATGPAADKIAKLRLKVNGSTLHAVKARIVMTRQQPIAAGSWAPAGGNWTYIGTPSSGAYEAEWDLAAATSMSPTANSQQDFAVGFTPGLPGLYRFTYSISATELVGTVETYQDVIITA